jgi:hypothetical protein
MEGTLMNHDTLPVVESLNKLFTLLLKSSNDFADFERKTMDAVMSCTAAAMGNTLAAFDDYLLENCRIPGSIIHDRKERTLLTLCGQVSFSRRVFYTQDKKRFCLLDEYLGIKPYARISPEAFEMVAQDALCDSYGRAAEILCRHTPTSLSRQSVKNIIRHYAESYILSDSEAAHDLFNLGLGIDARAEANMLCAEADGTWIRLQHEKKNGVEVKAFSAYLGKKKEGKKTKRIGAVHFAGVMDTPSFWKRSVARTASAYDLSKLKEVHVGTDGAEWCKKAGDYFKSSDVIGHLDPWHLKRKIYSALLSEDDAYECYWMCQEGRIKDALSVIDGYDPCDDKIIDLRRYIENNADLIGVSGPSLGTIECDNATIYKKRLSGRRSWSHKSLQAMCALLSHKASGDRLSRPDPKQVKRQIPFFGEKPSTPASKTLQSVGSGYEPPSGHIHQKGTDDWRFTKWAVDGIKF